MNDSISGLNLLYITNARIDNLRDNFLQVKRIDIYAKELVLLNN